MSYEIVFGDKALDRIPDWLPRQVLDALESSLKRLASDPVQFGEPMVFPDPRRGLKYSFDCAHEGRTFYFVAYFYYLENESDLRVYDVTFDYWPPVQ